MRPKVICEFFRTVDSKTYQPMIQYQLKLLDENGHVIDRGEPMDVYRLDVLETIKSENGKSLAMPNTIELVVKP